MIKTLIIALVMAVLPLCGLYGSGPGYEVIETANPVFYDNTVFSEPEDLTSAGFEVILSRYGLKEIVKDEDDEFNRILLLRNWLNRQLVIDRGRPAVNRDVLGMLAEGPKGGRYSCGHFEAAQNAVLNAMGYVTRCVLSGPDGTAPELTGSHGSNEVWSNSLCKWVMVDAEWDCHFEKDGVPLSALELRETYLDGQWDQVVRVQGPAREPVDWGNDHQWGNTPKAYACIGWLWQTDRFSRWPERGSSVMIVYNDEFFRNNVWYRSGKKNWAYDTGNFKRVEEINKINWTPNVLDLDVKINGSVAQVGINSCTPNLREYQMKREGGAWNPVAGNFSLELSGPREEFVFRSVNLAGVTGPVYRLVLEKK